MRAWLTATFALPLLGGCGLILDLDPDDAVDDGGSVDGGQDLQAPDGGQVDGDGDEDAPDMDVFCDEPTLIGPLRIAGETDEVGLCEGSDSFIARFKTVEWSGPDNVDEDADGSTDEGCYLGGDDDVRFLCGVGECATPMVDCTSSCEPTVPREERNDGLDNDCDGVIDEAPVPDAYAMPLSDCPAFDWETPQFFVARQIEPVSCLQIASGMFTCQLPGPAPRYRDLGLERATMGMVEEIRSAVTTNLGRECPPYRLAVGESIEVDRRLALTNLVIGGSIDETTPVFIVRAGGELHLREVELTSTNRGLILVEEGGELIVEDSRLSARGNTPTVEVQGGSARFYDNCSESEEGVCVNEGRNGVFHFGQSEALVVGRGSDVEIQNTRLLARHRTANKATVRVEGASRFEVIRSSIVRQGGAEGQPTEGSGTALQIDDCDAQGALIYNSRIHVKGVLEGDATGIRALNCALTVEEPLRSGFAPQIHGLFDGRAESATGLDCIGGACRIWNAHIAGVRGGRDQTQGIVRANARAVYCENGCDQIAGARLHGGHGGPAGGGEFVGLWAQMSNVRVGRTLMLGGVGGTGIGFRQIGGEVHMHDSFVIGQGQNGGADAIRNGWGVQSDGLFFARHNAFVGLGDLNDNLSGECVGAEINIGQSALLANIFVAGECTDRTALIAPEGTLFMISNFSFGGEDYDFAGLSFSEDPPRHFVAVEGGSDQTFPDPATGAFGAALPAIEGGATSVDGRRSRRSGSPNVGPIQR